MSIGGRLSKLLHSGFVLETQTPDGTLMKVPTALLKKGEGEQPQQTALPRTLWLCDWKDQAAAWYALAECPLISALVPPCCRRAT